MTCLCGHDAIEHHGETGRCTGQCYDHDYDTQYACLCYVYDPQSKAS